MPIHTLFCYYFLKTLDWNKFNDKSSVPGVNRNDVHQEIVSIPAISEQREIAAILGALDDKIELNRKMAATLEEMARALYRSWFVDFDPVHAKAEGLAPAHMDTPTAALFPDRFVAIGLPEGWAMGSLKVATRSIRNGGTPKKDILDFWAGGTIPWLTSGEVRQSIICSTKNYISQLGLSGSSAKWIEAGAILVALYGATAGQVSRTAIRLTTNQAICAISTEAEFQNYIYFVLKEQVESLADKAIGSAQQNISKKIVEDLEVLLPPIKLVAKFQDVTAPIFSSIENCWHESESLATLRDTLLPRLMSGELRVGEAREQMEAAQ